MVNNLYVSDAVSFMKNIENDYVDLTITSPPYDNLRNYNGYSFDYKPIANELFRITKKGGIVVWIVSDSVVKGSETLTSFQQALYFKEIGFNVHDTMIYMKKNPSPNAKNRYQQCFEYMFVFSKGKPITTNILTRSRKNKCNDKRIFRNKSFNRDINGEFCKNNYFVKENVPRENIWDYYVGGGNSTKDKIAFKHPAIFPEKLVEDHILSWSNEGDIVFDPMIGSGTTAKIAKINNRKFIGCDVSEKYIDIARKRLEND